jgi:hypothetical protein
LYERCHVCSVSDLLALHLHNGFIPGIYSTVLKQNSWGKCRIGFHFCEVTLSCFEKGSVCYIL